MAASALACCPDSAVDDFAGKAVMVTGSGAGIGHSIARHFLARGATVMFNDLSASRLGEATSDIAPEDRDRVVLFDGDVREPATAAAMVQTLVDRCGTIDVLVNNAGIYPATSFLDLPAAEWDAVMDTNVKGAFLVSQSVARAMVAGGQSGQIITISSGSYATAREGCAHYCASKAALVMLSKVMAMELARHRIRVNIVLPGVIDVGSDVSPLSQPYKQATVKQVPWGRLGQSDDVAHAVLHIAAPELDYVTGALLAIDGGLSLGRYGIPQSGSASPETPAP